MCSSPSIRSSRPAPRSILATTAGPRSDCSPPTDAGRRHAWRDHDPSAMDRSQRPGSSRFAAWRTSPTWTDHAVGHGRDVGGIDLGRAFGWAMKPSRRMDTYGLVFTRRMAGGTVGFGHGSHRGHSYLGSGFGPDRSLIDARLLLRSRRGRAPARRDALAGRLVPELARHHKHVDTARLGQGDAAQVAVTAPRFRRRRTQPVRS